MKNTLKKEGKTTSPMACLFIGRSGCGKGTQVELFIKKIQEVNGLKTLRIETGSLLRELATKTSFTAEKTKKLLDKGALMPESLVIGLWSSYLIENYSGKENLVFDGLARRLPEALILDAALKFYGISSYKVIYINVSRKWGTERLLARKRKDDTEEDIKNRMDWFDTNVSDSIEYFKKNKNCDFIDVNGEQTIEEVHAELAKKVFGK